MKQSTFLKAISTAVLSLGLLAANTGFAVTIKNRPYGGLGVGAANTSYTLDQQATSPGQKGLSFDDNSFTSGKLGAYIGDELDIDQFSAAIELSGAIYGGDDTADSGTKVSTPYAGAISFLPGYYITPRNHIFGRIGVMSTALDLSDDGSLAGVNFPGNDFNLTAPVFGLGYEFGLTKGLFLRAEYDHVSYADDKNDSAPPTTFTNASGELKDVQQNMVTLSLNYKL